MGPCLFNDSSFEDCINTDFINSSAYETGIVNGPNASRNGSDDIDINPLLAEPAYRTAMGLVRVGFPVLVCLGTVCNAMVLVLLRRGAVSTGNLSFFLAMLAVTDTIFLYSSGAKAWIRVMWGVELLHLTSWSCQVGLFVNHLSMSLSAWLVVLVAWQRWYTLSRPFQRCCPVESKRCGHFALVGLVALLVVANSYVFITVRLVEHPYYKKCSPREQYFQVLNDVLGYIVLTLYSGLPAVLLILLNALLARVLYASRRALLPALQASRSSGDSGGRCGSTGRYTRPPEHVRSRYQQVTGMLLALSASWLLLTTPHTIFKILEPIDSTPRIRARLMLLNVITFLLLYLNHSINFLLYCALIRGFRREIRTLFSRLSRMVRRPCRGCCCPSRSERSSNTCSTTLHHNHIVANNRARMQQRQHQHHNNHHHHQIALHANGIAAGRDTGSFIPLLENNGAENDGALSRDMRNNGFCCCSNCAKNNVGSAQANNPIVDRYARNRQPDLLRNYAVQYPGRRDLQKGDCVCNCCTMDKRRDVKNKINARISPNENDK